MGGQALRGMVARGELIGVGILLVIGLALVVLAPKPTARAAAP
jgi:hypothetical protein